MILTEEFKNPSSKYRIKPFWFWNGEMTKEEITHQIEEMADKGLGGVFICARQGMTVPYLSKEWFDLTAYAVDEAKRCGLEAWLYDEYPYPSGMAGGEVLLEHPEAEHKILKHHVFYTEGGKQVEEDLGWEMILFAKAYHKGEEEGEMPRELDLMDDIGILQTEKIYQKTGLTKYNNKRFFSYGPRKMLRTVLPEGDWKIEVYTEATLGDFKYYGGFFDPCDQKAVATFIDTTYERYKKHMGEQFGHKVIGTFSDEVGLLSPIPWSSKLPEAFEKRNGYNLLDVLPALHDCTFPNAYKIRYDLYQTAHELFRASYHKQVADWCHENNLLYATEVPSMRMSTQMYSDVVGGDTAHEKLGKSLEWIYDEYIRNYRSNAKAVSSLARQLNKQYAMIESFHSVGWSMTLQDAKWMIDRLGSNGINLYNFHAFYYTIQDITKHDAPPSQFLQNPYWKHYRKLADYTGRMGVFVSHTVADIQIAVLDPVATLWTKLGNPFHGFPYKGESEAEEKECNELREKWVKVCKTLLFHQLDYDHLDEEILQQAEVRDGKMMLGSAAYSVVVLPPCHCMERKTREVLKRFLDEGGSVIGIEILPSISLDSDEADDVTKQAWKELFAAERSLFIDNTEKEEALVSACRRHIKETVQVDILEGNPKEVIACTRLGQEGVPYVFIANQGKNEVVAGIKGEAFQGIRYDLESGDMSLVRGNGKEIEIRLGAFESQLIRLETSNYHEEVVEGEGTKAVHIPMSGNWNVKISGKNICRFGEAYLSLDQSTWKKAEVKTFIEQMADTALLGEQQLKYCGEFGTPRKIKPAYPVKCWYRIPFHAEVVPEDICLMMDKHTIAGSHEIRINGNRVDAESWQDIWVNDQNNRQVAIEKMVHQGDNLIEVQVLVEQDEDGLRDPIYLTGTFGVHTLEKEGERILNITKQPSCSCPDAYWHEGFPYYSGELAFTANFTSKELGIDFKEAFEIVLDFSTPVYDCMEVLVNGNSLGVKAYTPYIWECRPAYIKDGQNKITVRLTNTLCNMLDGTYFDYHLHKLIEIKP